MTGLNVKAYFVVLYCLESVVRENSTLLYLIA